MSRKINPCSSKTSTEAGAGRGASRGFLWALASGVGAALGVRALALPSLLPDLDAVNFARALGGFDLAAQAPHFPGYPVYVALARVLSSLGATEVAALALPGLVLGALAVAVLGLVLRPRLGDVGALGAAGLLALLPLPVLFGATPASDGTGLALLVLAACAVLRLDEAPPRAAVLAGAVTGLALGARPSFLPALLGLVLFVPRARLRAALGAGALAVAAWFLPLVVLTGPLRLVRIGTGFLHGHASEWGGTVVVRPELGWRLEGFGFDLLAAGLGLPWPGDSETPGVLQAARFLLAAVLALALGALVLAAVRRSLRAAERRVAGLALAVGGPYLAWMFLGQNLLKARHALPGVFALALLVAVGLAVLERTVPRAWLVPFTAVGALALGAVTLPVALEQGGEPAPAVQLVRYVASTLPPSGTLLFTGEEARLFEHYAPPYRAGRPATGEQLRREVERVAAAGANVYVTSAAPGVEALASHLEPVTRFVCARRVRSHAHELTLFRYRPTPLAASDKVF